MDFINSDLVQSIGWTLIHSLWQSTFILAITVFFLQLFQKKESKSRYLISIMSILSILFSALFTFILLYDNKISESYINTGTALTIKEIAKANGPDLLKNIFLGLNIFFSEQMPIIVGIWLSIVTILSIKFLSKICLSQRIKNGNKVSVDTKWLTKIDELSEKLSLKKSVKIFESSLVNVPSVIGFIKPIILLPISALSRLESEHIEMILLHELSHIKRNDYIINILQTMVDILFFYNPAYLWISKQVRAERELISDDTVMSVSGNPVQYAKALTSVEDFFIDSQINTVPASIAITGNTSSLKYRIKRLFKQEEKVKYKPAQLLNIICLLLFTTGILFTEARNDDKSKLFESKTRLEKLNADTVTIQRIINTGLFSNKKVTTRFINNKLVSVNLNGKNLSENEFHKYNSYLKEEKESEERYLAIMEQEKNNELRVNLFKKDLGNYLAIDETGYFEISVEGTVLSINGVKQNNKAYLKYKELSEKYFKHSKDEKSFKRENQSGYINIKTTVFSK